MSLSTRMVVVLTAIGLLSGSLLSIVGTVTKERIRLNRIKEIERAVLLVVPAASTSQTLYEENNFAIHLAKKEDGEAAGYGLQAAGSGFQDKITVIIGTNLDLTRITSLTIIDQKETPGLGAKITDKMAFLRYWENRDCTGALKLRKPPVEDPAALRPEEVNAITGATISSQSVLNIVNTALARAKQLLAEGKFTSGK